MAWFRRKRPVPAGDDWITVPFRIAEASRLSIYTIGSHPELPDSLRVWIAGWLGNYNSALTSWFEENYGPDIFEHLARITQQVLRESSEAAIEDHAKVETDAFARWESEFEHGGDESPGSTGTG